MTSRFFSRDKLEELDVPDINLHDEQHDTRCWSEVRRCIFRAPDDGKSYRVTYQVPLTEHQKCDLWFDEQQIEAFPVEQRPVLVLQWRPAAEPRSEQADEEPALHHLTKLYSEAGHRDQDAQRYAAELLAKHAREIAALVRSVRVSVYEDAGQRVADGVLRGAERVEAYARGLVPDA